MMQRAALRRSNAIRMSIVRPTRSLCAGLGDEDPTRFMHKSMYPQRDRVRHHSSSCIEGHARASTEAVCEEGGEAGGEASDVGMLATRRSSYVRFPFLFLLNVHTLLDSLTQILYSFANALHERELFGDSTMVTAAQLKDICYRAAKLPEEDVKLLIEHAAGTDFETVDLRDVNRKIAELLPPKQQP